MNSAADELSARIEDCLPHTSVRHTHTGVILSSNIPRRGAKLVFWIAIIVSIICVNMHLKAIIHFCDVRIMLVHDDTLILSAFQVRQCILSRGQ